MAKQTVALYSVTSGERFERARASLADALGDAKLGDPDDAGIFELSVDAESPEAARDLVREAFARAGTGDDFVLRETTEGREMPADDPRQGPEGATADPSARVADAASAVAAAASGAAKDALASDTAASAREAASSAAESAREAATSAAGAVREAVDEKGVSGAASDYASSAASAAQRSPLRKFAPIGGLLLLLLILRRRR